MSKLYKIIYADPPWHYNDKSKSHGGGAESHYKTMKVSDICNLAIPADKDSVLLLWATYPQLEEAFKVINAWGFKYKTCAFTWVKINKNGSIYMGMGGHTRANAEICLLASRGKGLSRINAGIYNTQLHQRSKHSEKPDAFRQEIVRLYGDVPRLEMFARTKSDGWDSWGNEIVSDIYLAPKGERDE